MENNHLAGDGANKIIFLLTDHLIRPVYEPNSALESCEMKGAGGAGWEFLVKLG